MIGRLMGAVALSEMRKTVRHLLVILVPAAAFAVILILPILGIVLHEEWQQAARICSFSNVSHYGLLLMLLVVFFLLGEASPHRMLALFSAAIIVLLSTGI